MPNMININFLHLLIMCVSGLVVKALMCFYEIWVQSLMDACLNVSCTNAI
jgi:hypothetical protein